MDTEQLAAWRTTLLKKVTELEARIEPLRADLEKTRAQIELVEQLLDLEEPSDEATTNRRNSLPSQPESVAGALAEILRTEDRPLHISEIERLYLDRGWRIPGKGRQSNLIAYLSRDARFVRVSKGTYELIENEDLPK